MENDCNGGALRFGVLIIAIEAAIGGAWWLVWSAIQRFGG